MWSPPTEARLFTHHSNPYIQFSSYCPCSSKISKDNLTGCSSRPCWRRRFHCGKENGWPYMPMGFTFISPSVRPSVCLSVSVIASTEPWIHHPIHLFIDAFICYLCSTLNLVRFLYRPLYEILEAVEVSTTRSAKHWFILPCGSRVEGGRGGELAE